jgi:hypothetical protein
MRTVILYQIHGSEKNFLWYPKIAGRTINEAQFSEVLAKFWLDFTRIERKVRDINPD